MIYAIFEWMEGVSILPVAQDAGTVALSDEGNVQRKHCVGLCEKRPCLKSGCENR